MAIGSTSHNPANALSRHLYSPSSFHSSTSTTILDPPSRTMASATGIPQENPATQGRGEDEPLLGRAGDASQQEGKGLQFNFVLGKSLMHGIQLMLTLTAPGTAIIAQAGIWIVCWPPLPAKASNQLTRFQLTATVWASVFIAPLSLFSAHPVRLFPYARLLIFH